MVEYDDWYLLEDNFILKKFNLLLGPILYLVLEFVVYTFILILIENYSYYSSKVSDSRIKTKVDDSKVLSEIVYVAVNCDCKEERDKNDSDYLDSVQKKRRKFSSND